MPWPQQQKQQTRQAILSSATTLFAKFGYHQVAIDDVMKHAHLTRGAFYAHFKSKRALYQASIEQAIEGRALSQQLEQIPAAISFEKLVAHYLSDAHISQQISPCPQAAFATDVSQQDNELQQTYTQVFQAMVTVLEQGIAKQSAAQANEEQYNQNKCHIETGNTENKDRVQEQALAMAAMMIGGVVISRALADDSLINALRQACITMAAQLK